VKPVNGPAKLFITTQDSPGNVKSGSAVGLWFALVGSSFAGALNKLFRSSENLQGAFLTKARFFMLTLDISYDIYFDMLYDKGDYMHRHCEFGSFESRERHGHFGRGGFFGRFGAGFMGGPGMVRGGKMLASSDLQLIILVLLSQKPSHGYEIIKQVEEHSSGMYSPSPGMVYPALTYLEEMGYAASESEGTKKLYRITETGTAYLNENRAGVEETLDQMARFGRKVAEFQKQFAEENEESEDSGRGPRRGIRSDWREAKQEFRELRNDLKTALYEKVDASPEERKRVFAILRRAIEEIRSK
jgi:DNA-binding PadR family transcriptional regulator